MRCLGGNSLRLFGFQIQNRKKKAHSLREEITVNKTRTEALLQFTAANTHSLRKREIIKISLWLIKFWCTTWSFFSGTVKVTQEKRRSGSGTFICKFYSKENIQKKLTHNFQGRLYKFTMRGRTRQIFISGCHSSTSSLIHFTLSHLADDTFQAERQMYELIDVICRTEACHAWNIISHRFA